MTGRNLTSPSVSGTGGAQMSTVVSTGSSHLTSSGPTTSGSASASVIDGPDSSRLRPAAIGVVALFVTTVVAANVLTARYGLISVGFGLTATAGTAAAGVTLLARDWVHHRAGRTAVFACITTGAVISGGLAGPRLALASALAFAVSELADLLVYQRLTRRYGGIVAAAVSNAVGAPVDTVLFLAVAGLPIAMAVPGQLWVKMLATILPLALITVTRALLRHRLRPPRP